MKSRLHAHIGTFRQLEILLTLHECGSVKGAAERLFLTQPTVSMQLKKLSEAVGLPLYQQQGKSLNFTEAGLMAVETAKRVLNHCERLDMELAQLKGLKSGLLKVAVVTSAKYFIPYLLGPFCQQYPDIDVQLTVENRAQIIERLKNGEDDFYVFSHPPEELDIDIIPLLPNALVAIASDDHPLRQNKQGVSLEAFCRENFLIREPGSGSRYAIDKFFAQHQLKPNVRMTIASNEAIIHSVISGLGVAILSEHALAFANHDKIRVLNVKGMPIESTWSFVSQRGQKHSPVAEAFLAFIKESGQSLLAQAKKMSAQPGN